MMQASYLGRSTGHTCTLLRLGSASRALPRWVRIVPLGLACLTAGSVILAQEPASPTPPSPPAPQSALAPPGSPSPSAPAAAKHQKHKSQDKQPLPPGVKPNAIIPVTPLGFSPPAPYYIGDRVVLASLDFLDEETLLFTFRVPGLIPRESSPGAQEARPTSRNIRALVLSVSSGKIKVETLWRLHDFQPYLWMLKDGKFLLRDRNAVQLGDAQLQLTPFLRFPGTVQQLALDPGQHLLLANSFEAAQTNAKQESTAGEPSNNPAITPAQPSAPISPPATAPDGTSIQPGATAATSATISITGHWSTSADQPTPAGQNLVRILNLEDRSVLFFSRVPSPIRLPLDGSGYYEALRGSATHWQIVFTYFNGTSAPLAQVESTCSPALEVEAPGILLVSACTETAGRKLVAISRSWEKDKSRIWEAATSPTSVWPVLTHALDGLRIARATLEVTHSISPYTPLDSSDIRGQTVQVYDLATGKVQLSLPVWPILDAGGNFALSPSGNRFAVLHGGAIEIYDLPPPPPLPAAAPPTPPRR